jgi:hypothetical protein
MNAKRLPARKQRAKLTQSIDQVLRAGTIGVILSNTQQKRVAARSDVPDYIFKPDVNPELSFLVYSSEVELLVDEHV